MDADFHRYRSKTWPILTLILGGSLLGLLLTSGADRSPADPSIPLTWERMGASSPALPPTIRVVSFNIHGGKGHDRQVDLMRTAGLIGACDLAGLYEVRSAAFGPERSQATTVARQLEMSAVFAATERYWWHDHFGNALLSRTTEGSIQRLPLPGTRGKAFRNAILAHFPWGSETLSVIAVHIDREQDRPSQLRLMKSLFLSLQPPVILMGDLNSTVDDAEFADLLQADDVLNVLEASRGDSPLPTKNIDWILTRGIVPVSAGLIENVASDHPLVYADLRSACGDMEN